MEVGTNVIDKFCSNRLIKMKWNYLYLDGIDLDQQHASTQLRNRYMKGGTYMPQRP